MPRKQFIDQVRYAFLEADAIATLRQGSNNALFGFWFDKDADC